MFHIDQLYEKIIVELLVLCIYFCGNIIINGINLGVRVVVFYVSLFPSMKKIVGKDVIRGSSYPCRNIKLGQTALRRCNLV